MKKVKVLKKKGLLEDFRKMESLKQKNRYTGETPAQRRKSNYQAKERTRQNKKRDREEEEAKKRLHSYEEDEDQKNQRRKYWKLKSNEYRDRKRQLNEQTCSTPGLSTSEGEMFSKGRPARKRKEADMYTTPANEKCGKTFRNKILPRRHLASAKLSI